MSDIQPVPLTPPITMQIVYADSLMEILSQYDAVEALRISCRRVHPHLSLQTGFTCFVRYPTAWLLERESLQWEKEAIPSSRASV